MSDRNSELRSELLQNKETVIWGGMRLNRLLDKIELSGIDPYSVYVTGKESGAIHLVYLGGSENE